VTHWLVAGQSPATPLTALGRAQAIALGHELKASGIVFDAVYSSTAVRAIDTAALAVEAAGQPKAVIQAPSKALLEQSHGTFEGQSRKTVLTAEVKADQMRRHFDWAAPNGESYRTVQTRAMAFITPIVTAAIKAMEQSASGAQWTAANAGNGRGAAAAAASSVATIGVFAHAGLIRSVICGLMRSDERAAYRIGMENTAISEFRFQGGEWSCVQINSHSHIRCKRLTRRQPHTFPRVHAHTYGHAHSPAMPFESALHLRSGLFFCWATAIVPVPRIDPDCAPPHARAGSEHGIGHSTQHAAPPPLPSSRSLAHPLTRCPVYLLTVHCALFRCQSLSRRRRRGCCCGDSGRVRCLRCRRAVGCCVVPVGVGVSVSIGVGVGHPLSEQRVDCVPVLSDQFVSQWEGLPVCTYQIAAHRLRHCTRHGTPCRCCGQRRQSANSQIRERCSRAGCCCAAPERIRCPERRR
jgi:broad specificity phosphatase PhoE